MRIILIAFAIVVVTLSVAAAQSTGAFGTVKDDGRLVASTKQLNQFFRRFNAEESPDGSQRYYPGDSLYHNIPLRQGFIQILFDNQTGGISKELKKEFIDEVLSANLPQYLNFHQEGWIAEVQADFLFKGKREQATLLMKIQAQGLGYEWVIDAISFDPFKDLFSKPKGSEKDFLHPLSHELTFMNMRKAFENTGQPESFTKSSFSPDYLTIFLYEMKKGNLKFQTVNKMKFHFFQIDGWYFEVAQFNRPGFNTGWLISTLSKLEVGDKEVIQKYIYDQDR